MNWRPAVATNLERATYRTLHSVKRRMAGEHAVEVNTLVEAFASEWMLSPEGVAMLYRAVVELERQAAGKRP